MRVLSQWILLAAALGLCTAACRAPEPEDSIDRDYGRELPRLPPRSTAQALQSFELREGFQIELAASEPLIRDPIALSFDEQSRLYVLEMAGYSEQREERLGAVRRLEDRDGDGFFETATLFVKGLSWPTGLIWANGGLYVGQAPDLLFFPDRDGDGRADSRQVVFTGFGTDNVQGLLNGFVWGLDNRIHGSASSTGGSITRPGEQRVSLDLRGRDFSFDPHTHSIRAESGGGQYGLSLDSWGRKFACHNSDHVISIVYEDRYAGRNPFLQATQAAMSASVEGRQAPLFRLSTVEPWRTLRTRLRVKGLVRGPVEGGGTASGYVTGASGIMVYKGDLWPREFVGNLFTGEVSSNLILHSRPEDEGVVVRTRRVEQGTEFLRSSDNWFRPAFLTNGPDGALYLADMYREVVEHPDSLPPTIKRHLDLTSGRDRGRIYRIVPRGSRRRPWPRLADTSTEELVKLLDHPNGWHRETASRLLYERGDESSLDAMKALARRGTTPQGRLHALQALQGLSALRPDDLLAGLADPSERVRIRALILSESFLDSNEVFEKVSGLASDADIRVRFQAAFTLGESSSRRRLPALATILERDGADPWLRMAVMSSLRQDAAELFARLFDSARLNQTQHRGPVLGELAIYVAAASAEADLDSLLSRIARLDSSQGQLAVTLTRGVMAGLQRSGRVNEFRRLIEQTPRLGRWSEQIVTRARVTTEDGQASAQEQAAALRDLAFGTFSEESPVLLERLQGGQALEVQLAALQALASFPGPQVGSAVIDLWPGLSPGLRTHAIEVLLSRKQRIESLLQAIEDGRFSLLDLDSTRRAQLLSHREPAIRQRASRLFNEPAGTPDLEGQIRRVLALRPSPAKGKRLFRENCSQCHRLEGAGYEVGPSLTAYAGGSGEKLLTNVLDPNRELNPRHVFYVVETRDGQSHSGVISGETASAVTLLRPNGVEETILRRNVSKIESLEVSIMPQGWVQLVGEQGLADLASYITGLE